MTRAALALVLLAGCAGAQPMAAIDDARDALAQRGPVLDEGVAALDRSAVELQRMRDFQQAVCTDPPIVVTPQQCDDAAASFNSLRDDQAKLRKAGSELQRMLDMLDQALAMAQQLSGGP